MVKKSDLKQAEETRDDVVGFKRLQCAVCSRVSFNSEDGLREHSLLCLQVQKLSVAVKNLIQAMQVLS